MSKNVTLRMDEQLLAELRHRAVDAHMSLSAWITASLSNLAPKASALESARARAIARMEKGFHMGGRPMNREDIHAR